MYTVKSPLSPEWAAALRYGLAQVETLRAVPGPGISLSFKFALPLPQRLMPPTGRFEITMPGGSTLRDVVLDKVAGDRTKGNLGLVWEVPRLKLTPTVHTIIVAPHIEAVPLPLPQKGRQRRLIGQFTWISRTFRVYEEEKQD